MDLICLIVDLTGFLAHATISLQREHSAQPQTKALTPDCDPWVPNELAKLSRDSFLCKKSKGLHTLTLFPARPGECGGYAFRGGRVARERD